MYKDAPFPRFSGMEGGGINRNDKRTGACHHCNSGFGTRKFNFLHKDPAKKFISQEFLLFLCGKQETISIFRYHELYLGLYSIYNKKDRKL